MTDLMRRRQSRFVLWRPGVTHPAPAVVIGRFMGGEFHQEGRYPLAPEPDHSELWTLDPFVLGLDPGVLYYYFEVEDTMTGQGRRLAADPFATCVDYRCLTEGEPASVVMLTKDALVPCDPDGTPLANVPAWPLSGNNRTVIYELPTTWTRTVEHGHAEFGTGSFADVLALLDEDFVSHTFTHDALGPKRAHLIELGINALELLPPADAGEHRKWGYGTRHHLSPDFDLGTPDEVHPYPVTLMADLKRATRDRGIRFFYDAVMAFVRECPYRWINYDDFFVRWGQGDPEQGNRDGFGGDLVKYRYLVEGYDPVTGDRRPIYPSRQWMLVHLIHWQEAYGFSGLRIDSITNIDCWDFLSEICHTLRGKKSLPDDRFLIVGEELSLPPDLLIQNRVDAVWNDEWKYLVRHAILGQSHASHTFQETVERLIDCRRLPGISDLSQAVNYVTSHDVGNDDWSRRLYNFLLEHDVWDTAPRIKLAFACLLTAVGIPMFLAGEEFADEHDLPPTADLKQVDPVHFGRLNDEWRRDIFRFVSRLVRLRTTAGALAVNDVEFLHFDFEDEKRVAVWRRGRPGLDSPVIVVANFSEASSDGKPYVVPNFPSSLGWRDVGEARPAPQAGREPLTPWSVHVYALSDHSGV